MKFRIKRMKSRRDEICLERFLFAVPLSLALMWLVSLTVFAQGQPSRQLTLIVPNNQAFDALVKQNFPGILELDAYPTVRPFLVLLRNDTPNPAEAYAIMWEVGALDGHTIRLQNFYIRKHFLPRTEIRPLKPGEIRLLAPFLNVNPDQHNVQHDYIAQLMASMASTPLYSQHRFSSVTPTLDATIYDDGAYGGSDHFQLLVRYQSLRDAERDEGSAVAEVIKGGARTEDVVVQLREHAKNGQPVSTTPGHPDRATLYALYRGREAQNLLTHYEHGGDVALRRQAEAMANQHQEALTALPPASTPQP